MRQALEEIAGRARQSYRRAYRQEHRAARVILVVGMMRDKDREGFLRTLMPIADELVLTQAGLARAATVEELASDVAAVAPPAMPVHQRPAPAEALSLARRLAQPQDLICVTGSLILVGEIKAVLQGCGLSPIRG